MAEEIIICRCEDITREKLMQAIAEGCETIDEIKRVTRAGMGPCQGKTCGNIIAQELSKIYGIPIEEVLMPSFRAPFEPINIGVVADAYEEGEHK